MTTIIFDWKQTLYDPETKQLIENAVDLLDFLKEKNTRLLLIGKGDSAMYDEINRLGVHDYFDKVIFTQSSKTSTLFHPFIDKRGTIVIGDRIRSEIAVGNELDAITIWVKQGKFKDELPRSQKETPTYTANSLLEIKGICQKLWSQSIKNSDET